MPTRYYFENRMHFKGGKFAGFRWRIQRTESSIQKRGRYRKIEVKYKVLRRNKLNVPTYSDLLAHLDEYWTGKKRMNDVWRTVFYRGGKIIAESIHKTYPKAKFNDILYSFNMHLRKKDHAKSWRPPKR